MQAKTFLTREFLPAFFWQLFLRMDLRMISFRAQDARRASLSQAEIVFHDDIAQGNLQLSRSDESSWTSVLSKAKAHMLGWMWNKLSHTFLVHRSLMQLYEPVWIEYFVVGIDTGIPHLAAWDEDNLALRNSCTINISTLRSALRAIFAVLVVSRVNFRDWIRTDQ